MMNITLLAAQAALADTLAGYDIFITNDHSKIT